MMKRCVVVAAWVLMPWAVHAAQTAEPAETTETAETIAEATHEDCMDKAGSTAAMMTCIGAEYERQDARLNAAYKALQERASDERQTPLRDAQRAWIAYRDANCAFYSDPGGGTLAQVSANDCMRMMTEQRADELEGAMQQP